MAKPGMSAKKSLFTGLTVGMKILRLILCSLLALSVAQSVWAERMYVTDQLVVTVRAEKSTASSIIGRARSLQAVEVDEIDGPWALVALENGAKGWMQAKYLIDSPPAALKVLAIQSENEDLAAKLERLKDENERLGEASRTLRQRLKEREETLEKLQADHSQLSQEAGEYLEMKEKYDQVVGQLTEAQARVKKLEAMSDTALSRRRLKWFVAGGGVLIAGWLIGAITTRRRRRAARYY